MTQAGPLSKAAAHKPPVQNAPTGEKTATPPGGKVVSFADWNGQVVDRSAPGSGVDIRGNGSAIVNGDLNERYPHLRDTPPVGRW